MCLARDGQLSMQNRIVKYMLQGKLLSQQSLHKNGRGSDKAAEFNGTINNLPQRKKSEPSWDSNPWSTIIAFRD